MKLNVLTKLMLGFMSLVVLMVATGVFSLSQLSKVSEKAQFIGTSDLPAVRVIGQLNSAMGIYRQKQLQHIIAEDQANMSEYENAIQEYNKKITGLFNAYAPLIANDDDRALMEKTRIEWGKYVAQSSPFLEFSRNQNTDGAIAVLNGDARTTYNESLTEALTQWADFNENFGKQDVQEAGDIYANAQRLTIGLLIVVAIAALITGFFLARSISQAAHQMALVAESISKGELEHTITVRSKDEMGDIADSFTRMIAYLQGMAGVAQRLAVGDLTQNVTPISSKDVLGTAFQGMVDSLRTAIRQVSESAETVSAAASQLASASDQSGKATNQIATTIQQVALGTTQQSEDVAKTASSVEQMGRAIEGVAKGAQEQAKAISKASAVTSRINTAIEQVASNAQSVTRDSAEAAKHSRNGAQTVKDTISGMEVHPHQGRPLRSKGAGDGQPLRPDRRHRRDHRRYCLPDQPARPQRRHRSRPRRRAGQGLCRRRRRGPQARRALLPGHQGDRLAHQRHPVHRQ